MWKKIIIISVSFLLLVTVVAVMAFNYFKPSANTVLDFIKEHPEKASIKLVRNDSLIVAQQEERYMPLASTVKIIIAIEYAVQASSGNIDPEEQVSIQDLDRFYVPNTDGGAHPSWLKSVENKGVENKISIKEITKGMISHSSNANTEWLSQKLGLENINNRIKKLNIQNHTDIYYLVSSLFVGKELFPDVKGKKLAGNLQSTHMKDYIKATYEIHEKLLSNPDYKTDLGDLNLDVQKVWSQNLPGSTVNDYVSLMQKINSRKYFSKETQLHLDEVMEILLENPRNREWLSHAGMKGGSTASLLTKALYATDKKGNKTELVYFLNDIEPLEMARLRPSMNQFELEILTDKKFRDRLKATLMN